MRLKISCFLLLVILFQLTSTDDLKAQIYYGARSSALNHSVTALDNHDWAVFANPATVSSLQAGVSLYYVRYYGLNELADMALAASYPTKWGVLLTGVHSYGFDLYRETELALGWAYHYENLKAALKVHYDHVAISAPYGNAFALGIDLGILFSLTEKVQIGAMATNLNRPELGSSQEERPRLMSLGFAYKPLDKGIFLADIVKDVRFPLSVRVGLEYPLVDAFVLRAGVGTQPVNTTFGAGLRLKKLSVNLAVEKHQELGWSPGLDVGFNF